MEINGSFESNTRAATLNGRAVSRGHEQGSADLEVRVLKLDAIFGHIQAILKQRTTRRVPRGHVDRGNVPGWLRGDPGRLRQAMLNHALSFPRREANGKSLVRRLEGQT